MSNLKKIIISILLIIGVSLAVLYSQLDNIIETGITAAGPETLKVDVDLAKVSLSPFSGKVSVEDLTIGQPKGYGEGPMAAVKNFAMKLETGTLLSNHIIIDYMIIDAPLLNARRQDGKTNFEAFQEGLELPQSEADTPSEITLTIRKLEIRNPRIKAKTDGFIKLDEDITLASFTLTNLGTDKKGLAPKEIARHVMDTLQPQITKALVAAGASKKVKQLATGAKDKLEKGIGGFLKKLKKKKKN